jgi:hypothetical protein
MVEWILTNGCDCVIMTVHRKCPLSSLMPFVLIELILTELSVGGLGYSRHLLLFHKKPILPGPRPEGLAQTRSSWDRHLAQESQRVHLKHLVIQVSWDPLACPESLQCANISGDSGFQLESSDHRVHLALSTYTHSL